MGDIYQQVLSGVTWARFGMKSLILELLLSLALVQPKILTLLVGVCGRHGLVVYGVSICGDQVQIREEVNKEFLCQTRYV